MTDLHHLKLERNRLKAEIRMYRGAAVADEKRLIAAAAKGGIMYTGIFVPDDLAEEIVRLRAKLAELAKDKP